MAEYEEVDKIYQKAYEKEDGETFIYITDTYLDEFEDTQTELDDFKHDRYEVRINSPLEPDEHEDTALYTSMEWRDAEKFLDNIATQQGS